MRFAAFLAKFRMFFGAVMLVVALPAIGAGLLAWRRGSDMALLGTIYLVGGAYLAYEGLVLVFAKRR